MLISCQPIGRKSEEGDKEEEREIKVVAPEHLSSDLSDEAHGFMEGITDPNPASIELRAALSLGFRVSITGTDLQIPTGSLL